MNKEMLMKIVSEISVASGARLSFSESNGKLTVELSPKADNNSNIDDDPPAEVAKSGTKIWKNKDGQIHRDNDLPAMIYVDGDQAWYKNGKLHRDGDLPAYIEKNGNQFWYKNDHLHRANGPAVIESDGTEKYWHKNGKLHRDGGKPAVIKKNSYGYWVDGNHILTVHHKDGVVEV